MNETDKDLLHNDDDTLHDEVLKLEQQLQEMRSVVVPMTEQLSSKSWKLERTEHELEIYKRRKVIQLLEAFRTLAKNPASPGKFTRKLSVAFRPNEPLVPPQRKDPPENLLSEFVKTKRIDANESPYTYPNLRVVSVAEAPSFNSLSPVIVLDEDWKETLRPDLNSVDLVLLEIENKDEFPYRLAKDVAKAAVKIDTPVVVAVHDAGSESTLLDLADIIVPMNEEIAEHMLESKRNEKIHRLREAVDVRKFNPVNWRLEPRGNLIAIGEKTGSKQDVEICLHLKRHLPRLHVYGPEKLSNDLECKNYQGDDLVECYPMSKSFKLTFLAPSMFRTHQRCEQAVLRLLAMGNHVATTNKQIVNSINVPTLHLVKNSEDAEKVSQIVSNTEQRERLSTRSRRYIMHRYSLEARFEHLLEAAGVVTDTNSTISIVLCTNRPDYIDRAIENVKNQTYESIELVMVLHGDTFDESKIRSKLKASGLEYKLVQCNSDMMFGECLNAGLDASSGYYVTKFDDDDHYGPEHLQDLAIALKYSGAHVVGKWAHYVYLEASETMLNYRLEKQERYVGHLPGGTFLITRALLSRFRFGRVRNAIDSELWYRIQEQGGRMYSTHRFNYVRVRHEENTWVANDEFFIEQSTGAADKGSGVEVGFV